MTAFYCDFCRRYHTSDYAACWLNDPTAPRDRDNEPPQQGARVYDAPVRDYNGEARVHAENARKIPVKREDDLRPVTVQERRGWLALLLGVIAGVLVGRR